MLPVMETTLEDLENLELFKGLSPAQLAQAGETLHRRILPPNCNLIIAEQPGQAVYIILNGTLKVHLEQPGGSDVILAVLGPGDIAGEMSVLDNTGRSASVTTLEESELLWMDGGSFQACLKRFPVMAHNLMTILSARVRRADLHIQALAALDTGGRVARQLLGFSRRYGRPAESGGILIPVRLTQGDLADLVGASRKRVNQVVVALKSLGAVAVDERGYFVVRDPAALEKMGGG